jgi:ferritin-like metal-binding protein YciE
MSETESRESSNQELKELLVDELKDLYNAETQLTRALPKMVKAAHEEKLKNAIEEHLHQTEGHVERLTKVFEELDEKARGKTCHGMMGLIEEGKEHIIEGSKKEENIADLDLISCAQKVEHYEISAYGTVRTLAEKLGESKVVELLSETEDEEKKADDLLTEIASSILENISGQ